MDKSREQKSNVPSTEERLDVEKLSRGQKIRKFLGYFVVYALLVILAIAIIFPFYWMINSSLKDLAEYKRYVEQTVVYDHDSHLLIGIMRDITDEEAQRERKEHISRQTIEVADKVVDKQMRIVQEIASLLGETAAETKIALSKLKESISDE